MHKKVDNASARENPGCRVLKAEFRFRSGQAKKELRFCPGPIV
jgi:hypothetical protein